MKRVICFLVSFVILFTSAYARENILTRDEIPLAKGEAKILESIGILKGSENGIELEREVTRAEAVSLISRIMKLEALSEDADFDDVPKGHWAYSDIMKARKSSIVHGVSEKSFEPDRCVTGKEFVKMILCALGYTDANIDNSYEEGVDKGILTNNFSKSVVYSNENLIRSDVIRICTSLALVKTKDGKNVFDPDLIAQFLTKDADNFEDNINAQIPKDKNYMFSPISIKTALALLSNGASGETQKQILDACGIDNLSDYNNYIEKLIKSYNSFDGLKISIANSIWINTDRTNQRFSDSFSDIAKTKYYGVSNETNDKNALSDINGWVKDKTNGKIPSIINNSEFMSYLVNAVYFKGAWQNKFNKGATKKDTFTDINGNEKNIDFMNQTSYFEYGDANGIKILKMPYKSIAEKIDDDGNFFGIEKTDLNFSMYIMMGSGVIENPVKALKNAEFKNTYVRLSMPKFKIEFSTSLNDILKNLGVKDAFDERKADFTNMFDIGNMAVTDTVHKTYINVDEEGTEAAAATGIGMATSSLPPEPVIVEFNKPFTFIICDDTNNQVLFIGSYFSCE